MLDWVPDALTVFGAITVALIGGWVALRKAGNDKTMPSYADLVHEVGDLRDDRTEDRTQIDFLLAERRKMDRRIVCLEDTLERDRRWIRRAILQVAKHHPEMLHLLRPFPDWHDDPPPDDGQPDDITRTGK